MHAQTLFFAALLAGLGSTDPLPDKDVPITQAEWTALREGGLKARASVNVPITKDEMAALVAGGLKPRGGLDARDKVMNCGHKVNGKGGSNGNGKWIPVQQFANVANEFCNAYVGTDIALDHETSDTYGITLTNQDDGSQAGSAGNIVFAIYNTERSPTYVVDHDTCLRAMQAPLGSHAATPAARRTRRAADGTEYVELVKRDSCYGDKHDDYKGGYYKIDDIGAFGSEVYAA
ncbi:hypothetical protein F4778DRAFT_792117 [Xylariomycetidae sp. FL2044]|nr:hypothetical protein F4778DRAFT_792117 [Xylariomycetidae sp. FL2044]